jgi:arylsulfatase A-like enzyme
MSRSDRSEPPADRHAWTIGGVGGVAASLAAASAVAEVIVVAVERQAHPLLRVGDDFVWMAAVALVVVTVAASMISFGVVGMVAPRGRVGIPLAVAATMGALNLLMLVPGLSHYAALVLALGAAVQISRVARRNPARTRRIVRASLPALSGALAAVAVGVWASSRTTVSNQQTAGGRGRSPNVLLVTLDTVRATNLSLYGYGRRTTPHIDRFAESGTVFENAFATAPWTLPSHASLFTGRWPHELSTSYDAPLSGAFPTLAEYLAGRGYATAGFVANLGFCSRSTGLARGFEHYEDYPRSAGQIAASSTLVRNVADNFRLRRLLKNDQHLNRVDAAEVSDRALRWIAGAARSPAPFFVFVNYFDAHEPYLPPPPYDRRFGNGRREGRLSPLHHWLWDVAVDHRPMTGDEIREEQESYDGALAFVDEQVGRLLDGLARSGVLDETVVVITSDHGEEFGEHGVFDHGYSLYRQALQVPLVIVAPGRQGAGTKVGSPVSLHDVSATLVDMLGQGGTFAGTSLVPLMKGERDAGLETTALLSEVERAPGQPAWFPASKGDMRSVITGSFHYIRNGDGREELYGMAGDPLERADLAGAAQYQQRLADARAFLVRLAPDRPGTGEGPTQR